ncbi:MAG TPA: hypothetical protein EYG51_16765 [Pseudomonadales bacterium]|nr:hypothetical protein [Pseudomonadales bacterium]
MEYSVGQILYLILKKKQIVLPVRVVEQILRRTVDGEEVKYIVEAPAKGRRLVQYPLGELSSEVFEDLADARKLLLANANEAIDGIISLANRSAEKHFITPKTRSSPAIEPLQPGESLSPLGHSADSIVEAVMDDGSVVKVRVPPELKEAIS